LKLIVVCWNSSVCPTLQQDSDLLTRQSSQRSVLLFYDDEPDEVINFFFYCTNLVPADPSVTTPTSQIVQVYGNGANEERILKKTLTKALSNVNLILKNLFFSLKQRISVGLFSEYMDITSLYS